MQKVFSYSSKNLKKLSIKVLIISPYFPPCNAADMQRVRMSLPYFKKFGWDAEVVVVDETYVDIVQDPLLLQSVPADIKIHKVKALNKRLTSKFSLGSLALRSMWYYRKKVNWLFHQEAYDLIYFSTTQFPVCILGAYWKKRFGVPYVIDVQDPWHSDHYRDKPKEQRPPKYWFSYRLNKYLEPIAMNSAAGLISVSENYIKTLKDRYPAIKNIPQATITFGAHHPDMQIAKNNSSVFELILQREYKNIVCIGRGGADMHMAISTLFIAFKETLSSNSDLFKNIRFYFIGTSYAPAGQGKPTIMPIAHKYGIADNVIEITDRISYYHTLFTLGQADALFIPGSDDPDYTASKLYPYLLTKRPLLALFNEQSPALKVLKEYNAPFSFNYNQQDVVYNIINFLTQVANGTVQEPHYNASAIEKYSAERMTMLQCQLFDEVLKK